MDATVRIRYIDPLGGFNDTEREFSPDTVTLYKGEKPRKNMTRRLKAAYNVIHKVGV